MKLLSTLAIILCLSASASAQHNCSSHTITQAHLAASGLSTDLNAALAMVPKGVAARGSALTIPVVFHVVWNTSSENVADQVIFDMLSQMNADYSATNSDVGNVRATFSSDVSNTGIQFCLADTDPNGAATTGITRTQTTDTWFDPDTETNDMKSAPKGIAAWNPNNYLNIWICDITSGAGAGGITIGYAYLPTGTIPGSSIDGLVIDYDYGTGPGARTATHEAGHYLGLQHPWGAGGCGSDDGFSDTPNTDGSTFSCANTSLVTCTSLVQYENFMDYASCSVMFTNDQASYMTSILSGVRSSLLTSMGCSTSSSGPCVINSAVGTADGDFIDGVVLGSINNTSTGGTTGNFYNDYTSMSTTLSAGNSYTITITSGDYQPDNYAAWIDYDQNGTFNASEKLGEFTTSTVSETQSFMFTVPATAMNGTTTMRVRGVYHDTGEPTPTDPCYAYTWGETEDYGIVVNGGSVSYCIPTSVDGTTDGDFIDAVVLGSINNTATGSTGGPTYVDYTSLSTMLYQGQMHSVSITSGAYTDDNYAAWVDYNMDGTFDTSEKLGEFATTTAYETQVINFTVPVGATIGSTVMRVRGVYHDTGEPSPSDPCFDYNWGETEDYTVMVDGTTGISEIQNGPIIWYQQDAILRVSGLHANVDLLLMDATGRIVSSASSTGPSHELNISQLSSGVYLLQQGDRLVRVYLN